MTLTQAVTEFMKRLPEMNDEDEEMNGGDAVEVLGEFWPIFKKALKDQKKRDKLAYDLAEALNVAYSSEMDRKDEARNFENDTLGYWEKLIAKSVTYWPRKEGRNV